MTGPTDTGGEGTLARLRRRKVVQWGLAYAAGAWALVEGLSHVVATFHWPERIQQVGTLFLFFGLPIALVVAWYHGDRSQQRGTAAEFTIILLLVVIGGGFLWQYGRLGGKAVPPGGVPSREPAATNDARPSIAVLGPMTIVAPPGTG